MIVRAIDKRPVEALPGMTRCVLSYGDKLMVVEVTLKEGTLIAAHQHPHEQITYVIRGTVHFTINRQNVVLAAGESCLIPSNAPHAAEALSDCLLLDAFSPPREDFI